jgi:carbon-monoxide dehydrogenase large subunit
MSEPAVMEEEDVSDTTVSSPRHLVATGGVLGNIVVRREDPALVTGHGNFTDNLEADDALHAEFVRSTVPHALITVDTSAAEQMDGVVGVVTADDLDRPVYLPFASIIEKLRASRDVTPLERMSDTYEHFALASDRVRFVGEPIAVVLARSRALAEDAAEAVVVDYEPLETVVTLDDALTDAVLLFPDSTSNVLVDAGSADGALDDAEVVVRRRLVMQRIAGSPIESRSVDATWDGTRLTVHCGSQMPHDLRDTVATFTGTETEAVRVVTADVGGGFGTKGSPYPEELVLTLLAKRFGAQVRWTERRTEGLQNMSHARDQVADVAIGARADGTITGLSVDIVQNAGAYPFGAVFTGMGTGMLITGCYTIPKVAYRGRVVVTNTTPVGPFRGPGRAEAAYVIERMVDALADELGMDPTELRRRNFVGPDEFPYTNASGSTYDSGNYAGALDLLLEQAGYAALLEEQAARRAAGDRRALGIGFSTYVEITNVMTGPEAVEVELDAQGGVVVRSGSGDTGQGHQTTFATIAGAALGLPQERISVQLGDTDAVPIGVPTGGSRSLQVIGPLTGDGCDLLIDAAMQHAADELECSVDDVVFDRGAGAFHVVGSPAISVGWDRVARASGGLRAMAENDGGAYPSFPFGAHLAVVEIDTDTGKVELQRFVAVDDCGTMFNPLLVEGQIHGGLAAGIAQALCEEISFDELGNPTTSNFADYGIITAAELPSFELDSTVTPAPGNVFGAKGIGESGTVGSAPAVVNAVIDGLSHLGVHEIDMAMTPERVWRALKAAREDARS